MNIKYFSIITGTGSYIPKNIIKNIDFLNNIFYDSTGNKIDKENRDIIEKFLQITEIEERRYVDSNLITSDIGYFAADEAIKNAKIDKEELDYIIVAHNFGDVKDDNRKVDLVPSIASRIKAKLKIKNPYTVAYDLPFGCPGWLQGVIQADYFIKSGDAKKILVIGAETLSRVSDPHDIDSMLYSDGAGAVVIESKESDKPIGILTHKTRSDTFEAAYLLIMGKTYNPDSKDDTLFIKMNGRKLYEYALNTVPIVVKECIEKIGLKIDDVKKVFIHQANAKMDYAMLNRVFKLFNIKKNDIPKNILPMIIEKIGNNSVATLPIMFDLFSRGKLKDHHYSKDDYFVFTSVGAGMNVNAIIYKVA